MDGSSSRRQGIFIHGDLTIHSIGINATFPSYASSARHPFRNLPFPSHLFNGRVTILEKILDHFKANSESTDKLCCWDRMVAIVGMGGMGKSETAIQFATQYRSFFPCAAFINAETEESTLDSFLGLAKKLRIVSEDRQRADLELVKDVYYHIDAAYEDKVLLIFDNAIKWKSSETDFRIFDYLPTGDLLLKKYPFIIITSQTSDWDQGIKTFQLEELSEEESLSFFRSAFNVRSSQCDWAFKKLNRHLQGYPLAMTLAASNLDYESELNSPQWLLEQIELFIEKFMMEDSTILATKINRNWPSKYNASLSTVWQLSFRRLKKEPNGPSALKLLQALSFYHVPVSIRDLKDVLIECMLCPDTPAWMSFDQLRNSIELLQRFQFLDLAVKEQDYSDQLSVIQSDSETMPQDLYTKFEDEVKKSKQFLCELRIHRLIQLVVRLEMESNEVFEDILRYLAFWKSRYFVRQLNVSAVEEACGRFQLSRRALVFVGLLALQGNAVARKFMTVPTTVEDAAATISCLYHLDKDSQKLNEEAIEVLRRFIRAGASTSNLIDKRCFAHFAMEMLVHRSVFPHVRDDGSTAWGIYLDSLEGIEDVAYELFSVGCSFTDVCSAPLLCENLNRDSTASLTTRLGIMNIQHFTKTRTSWKPELGVAQVIDQLVTFRERLQNDYPSRPKWDEYLNEKSQILRGAFWDKFESDIESCSWDSTKLGNMFSSLFDKIRRASSHKNFKFSVMLKSGFDDLDFAICNLLIQPRPREFLVSLMSAFCECLEKDVDDQLELLQNSLEQSMGFVTWVCSTWMEISINQGDLEPTHLIACLSRVKLLAEIQKMSDKFRSALADMREWNNLRERHADTYQKFADKFSESADEEIKSLVVICKEIQRVMPLGSNAVSYYAPTV